MDEKQLLALALGLQPWLRLRVFLPTVRDWRQASGQDQHSIFADPKYVKPHDATDRWDWSVRADSPNMGAAEGGATIGAFARSHFTPGRRKENV